MTKYFCHWCGQSVSACGLCGRCLAQLNADLDRMGARQQIAVLMVERRIEETARQRRCA